jgi:taurine dioxygenase
VLEAVFAISERPENVVRWKWTSGDGVLWDNRYTMHYAVADYGTQHRRVRRATIYD